MTTRIHRELTEEEIASVARMYHAWRGEEDAGAYEDVPGFCRGASLEEIAEHGFVMTPGRYVGAPDAEEDGEPFDVKIKRLRDQLLVDVTESRRLEQVIEGSLTRLTDSAHDE